MRPRNQTAGGVARIASGVFGVAATFALGGCMLEEIVAPVEATQAPPVVVEAADAEAPPPAVEAPAQPRIRACYSQPLAPADLPLIMVDGIRTEAGFDEIAALAIDSFEIVRRADAVAEYGEAATNGVILIFTKKPDNVEIQHGGDRQLR